VVDFIGSIAIATKAIGGLKLLRGLEKTFDEASFKMQIARHHIEFGRSQNSSGYGRDSRNGARRTASSLTESAGKMKGCRDG
jgi:hypothetical protein